MLIEWLGAPEEAAAALRHARTIAPDDPPLADLLVAALVKAGRDREAARRSSRAAEVTVGGRRRAPRGELAALYIRLAQLRVSTG